ncbi:MAG: hypothetical protein QMD53_06580 [Actinomycetota bacterium]|nr:hypothetical protein [Actinomycetota bacterium]
MAKEKDFEPKLKVKKDLSIFSRPKKWPIFVGIAFFLLLLIVFVFLFLLAPVPS